jgi:predicted phage baseplate assembly protein
LTGTEVVEVSWRDEDGLPFPLCAWQFVRGRCLEPFGAAVVRGNVVLAEHGDLVPLEPVVPDQVPARGRYRPRLDQPGLAHGVPYRHAQAVKRPATEALEISPGQAVPKMVRLTDGREDWTVHPDLLGTDRFEPAYVVEMDDGAQARLRFGEPPHRQPAPGATVRASYRVGGGRGGNVGADVLTELIPPVDGVSVRNPLPARGGTDPEPVEQVRQWAPQAFRTQERAVTDADYRTMVMRHPQVQQAAATRRWTGSWYTEYVTIDRLGGRPVDPKFRTEVKAHLEAYRMAGVDVAVDAPIPVPLDIVFTVCVEPGQLRSAVQRALTDRFSARNLPGGGRGFFHPDDLTFAQPVYLSALVAAAMAVPGVRWVETSEGPDKPNRFRRWGQPDAGDHAAGLIRLERLEVARCDSDPSLPENGRIAFELVGGL